MNFEGCIEELELDARLVNLHKTKEALAVTTGCPPNVGDFTVKRFCFTLRTTETAV